MRTLIWLTVMFSLVVTTTAKGQLSWDDFSMKHDSSSTRLERIGYVFGSSLAFGLFDYVGINTAHSLFRGTKIETVNNAYHLVLSIVGVAVNYFLYKECGLPSALSFDVLWWSWTNDFMYMTWANVLNPASPWPNRTTEQFTENICCAGWTPVGLAQGYKATLSRSTLFAQSGVGIGVALALAW